MKRSKTGSTPKQYAYAMNKMGGKGRSKKEIALLSGFSPAVAENAKYKIENTQGFRNAVEELARESNNLVLAAMMEYKRRGLTEFSNKDLNGMLNAISSAWERIGKQRNPAQSKTEEGNPLRAAVLQNVNQQNVYMAPAPAPEPVAVGSTDEEDDIDPSLDF